MRAIRIPYPPPTTLPSIQLESLSRLGRIVDFPDRHVSYVLYDCNQPDVEQYVFEVLKTVDSHPRGEEPERLELRLTDSH